MQRRDAPEAQENKTGQQRGTEFRDPEAPEINHEPEDAREASALARPEPRGVDFHHPRRAVGLEVAVDSANGDEKPKQAPEGGKAKDKIHRHGAGGADQHGRLTAEPVGDQAVHDLAERISEQRRGDDRADVRLAETELV